ncbi:MAG: hypothetical protein Q9218_005444 [Villophora microphyllina]
MAPMSDASEPKTPTKTSGTLIIPITPAQIHPSQRRRALLFTPATAGCMTVKEFITRSTLQETAWPVLSSLRLGSRYWKLYNSFKDGLVKYVSHVLGPQLNSVNLYRVKHAMSDENDDITETAVDIVIGVAPDTIYNWQGLASAVLEDFVDNHQGPARNISVMFMPTTTADTLRMGLF